MADLADGFIAGAVATWAMGAVTTLLYGRENRAARAREDRARSGKTAYQVAAEKLARLTGTALTEQQSARLGTAIHWALGISAGTLYGPLRHRVPGSAVGAGLAYGTLVWLLLDEGATPALGLTPGPAAFPWQTHARGFAGHLVYGAVAERTLSLLDRGSR